MREPRVLEIGSGPADEPCAQVGQAGYEAQARAECDQFIRAIRRTLGLEPVGSSSRNT